MAPTVRRPFSSLHPTAQDPLQPAWHRNDTCGPGQGSVQHWCKATQDGPSVGHSGGRAALTVPQLLGPGTRNDPGSLPGRPPLSQGGCTEASAAQFLGRLQEVRQRPMSSTIPGPEERFLDGCLLLQ